jgi:hypothetical protein
MVKPAAKSTSLGTIALVIVLLGLLAASIWLAVHTWTSVGGPPLPINGMIAMTLGIVFSLVVGCGLMTLVFYSSRHGYDDQGYNTPDRPDEGDRTAG